MPRKLEPGKVINGTWGKMFFSGIEIFELQRAEAVVIPVRDTLNFVQMLDEYEKLSGLRGTGSFTVYKVNSFGIREIVEAWKKGIDPHVSIVFQTNDPDNGGVETIALNDCWFQDFPIVNIEVKKYIQRDFRFNFAPRSVEFEDLID
ncbi:phage tail tube protein [Aneurinibacillus aneurinilyticus]|uniref:Uncharacterized protein n=1 Tax=Aneurinibacillus aneurinilyticus ATCC 12856 TaxID=649747 RepID=U1WD41_ANEAE|nr:phage tail tube protein [Aneurinibacillus aneurinilyticus]ERI06464.1 hypothetical protein HMPREF0083_05306 [Aneurinibacillus aneurinilyticus ATCC 12856]MED0707079.1 phage tail tube protein [Aneurinibacillus aneurinilyticus]MED0732852.1 phage tail tube protein [Aneurinibacillus aneurinilyticus]MED0740378.1 phage tail tube protein [Aneurinibacillus aneurinilyticus]